MLATHTKQISALQVGLILRPSLAHVCLALSQDIELDQALTRQLDHDGSGQLNKATLKKFGVTQEIQEQEAGTKFLIKSMLLEKRQAVREQKRVLLKQEQKKKQVLLLKQKAELEKQLLSPAGPKQKKILLRNIKARSCRASCFPSYPRCQGLLQRPCSPLACTHTLQKVEESLGSSEQSNRFLLAPTPTLHFSFHSHARFLCLAAFRRDEEQALETTLDAEDTKMTKWVAAMRRRACEL